MDNAAQEVQSDLKLIFRMFYRELFARLGVEEGGFSKSCEDLIARYTEPHREYHNLEHIGHCLSEFSNVIQLAVDPNALEFAIFLHDAIYDTHRHDNVENSGVLSKEVIKDAKLPDSFGKKVDNLVLATKHDEIPEDPDAKLLVDIDLSILGQTPDAFNAFEKAIREEYKRYSDQVFYSGRLEILKAFLDRPSIYSTQFFRNRYEADARYNLAGAILQYQHILKQVSDQ